MRINNVALADGRIVDIVIKGTKITKIENPSSQGDIDGTGLVALPGGIDTHVHSRSPGAEHKEDWPHLNLAALKGGVTTVCTVGNNLPFMISLQALLDQREVIKAAEVKINVFHWLVATSDNLSEIKLALQEPDVPGVKVFLGSAPEKILVTNENVLCQIALECRKSSKILAVHPECESLMIANRRALGRAPTVADHARIHNTETEVWEVRRMIRVVSKTRCPIYLFHLSTPEAINLAQNAKFAGLPVYIQTCPHYFMFNEERLRGNGAGFFKINPALRTAEQAKKVLEYVRMGFVDSVDTDHAPHDEDEKQRMGYDSVPSGAPGIEERLPILLNLVSRGKLAIEQVARLFSINAARILGLATKGKIKPGYDADLVLVDMNKTRTFSNETAASKCGWTLYRGLTMRGIPQITIVAGQVAWSEKLI
ncbi:MAG: dihydroorotase family protein [Candidatus Nealsonbacteria bacterium]